MFVVGVSSELFGDTISICHKVTAEYVEIDMCYRPPTGTVLIVIFPNHNEPRASMRARAEVLSSISSTNATRVTMRLVEFLDDHPAKGTHAG